MVTKSTKRRSTKTKSRKGTSSAQSLSEQRRHFIYDADSGLKPALREDIVGMNMIVEEADQYVNFLRKF